MELNLEQMKEDMRNCAADMQIKYAELKRKYPMFDFEVSTVEAGTGAVKSYHWFDIKAKIGS